MTNKTLSFSFVLFGLNASTSDDVDVEYLFVLFFSHFRPVFQLDVGFWRLN